MPVDTQENTNKAKYILYYSDSFGGTYKRSNRAIVQSFRTQMKGLGAGSASYLPQDQLNETYADEELKVNMFVKILDGNAYWADEYTSIGDELFIGTIESVTTDIFQNSKDRQGSIIFSEIGQFLSTQPIKWAGTPQIFNPVLSGKCYGNRDSTSEDGEKFEVDPDKMVTAEEVGGKFDNSGSSNLTGNNRVWSLEQMLNYMGVTFGFDIEFPWDTDAIIIRQKAQNEIDGILNSSMTISEKEIVISNINLQANSEVSNVETQYRYFKESLEIRSFDHYDGKSVPQMLTELIEEPFSYYITYTSISAPTYVIVNKSPVKIDDICPASKMLSKTIDSNKIVNLNITEDANVYDSVTYKGNNILFCGSISPWVANQANSLERDWLIDDELKYVKGSDEDDPATELAAAQAYRMDEQADVYSKLKFSYYDEENGCYFRIPKKLNDKGEYTQAAMYPTKGGAAYDMVPFLPRVDFVKYENSSSYVLPNPLIINTLGTHKTPPKLHFKWAEKLPIENEKSKTLKDPYMICVFETTDSDPTIANSLLFQNVSQEGGAFNVQLKFLRDGLKVIANPPECLGANNSDLYYVEGQYPSVGKQPWKKEYVSQRNPETTTAYCSSWESSVFTVAAYSSQKLEWTIDNPNSTIKKKIKTIEDDTLECHVVHAGTIKKLVKGPYTVSFPGTLRNARTNGFERFPKDTFVRNDFKKLHTLCKQTSQWLFQPKRAMRLEEHLMLHTAGTWRVGEMIKDITDESIKHNLFTAVESIEYDAVMNRVRISTSFPQMPEFKRLRQQPISAANIAPTSDSKAPTIQQTSKVITLPENPTTGQVSGGGVGSSSLSVPVITVINGSDAQQEHGIDMVKVVTSTPVAVNIKADAENYVDGQTDFPDAIGVGRLATDGSIIFIVNMNQYLPYTLYAGDRFISTSTVDITGGVIPDTNPPETFYFKAYVPEVIL